MAKFIKNNAGNLEEEATVNSSTGVGDAGKVPALNANGLIDASMLDINVGKESTTLTSAEALTAGDIVHITAAGLVELADASDDTKPAMGFVTDTVAITTAVAVFFEGTNGDLSGMTPGAKQYLSLTSGEVTSTAPSATGEIIQPLGRAHSASKLSFEAATYLKLV